ncbi:MAG: sigma-70 family RNA polymerase sigma factor [Planctomycetia bacterium]|nr:sigma-70 family RNA polymerase sigma factor [Planctomycetia bacterium]
MNADNKNQQELASRVFLENYSFIRFIAFQSAPRRDLVEDIVNSTFIVFVNKSHQWDLTGNVKPLLGEITKNVAKNHWDDFMKHSPDSLRKIAEYVQRDVEVTGEILGSNNTVDEEITALGLCLGKLPEESRKLVEDYYYHHVPLKEIAKETGRKPLTLGKVLFRIRQTLRKCVERVLKGMGYGDK